MSHDDLIALPPAERLALISALWDSLDEAAPLTPAQATELESRLRSFEQDRAGAVSWDALKDELARRPG